MKWTKPFYKKMDAATAIKTRRSVRNYSDKKISEKELEEILEAGRWAPSGLNNQPWRFIIVSDSKVKEEVSAQTKYGRIINNAPLIIAVFLDNNESYDRTKDVLAVGACIQNMLLAVHSLRLGGCWMGEILKNKDEVKKILQAPEGYELMAVITIGHPKGAAEETERKEIKELITKKWT